MSAATEQERTSGTTVRLPLTSLIIGSRNRPKLLAETVTSVLQGNEVPTEIVVIDQSDPPHPELGTLQTKRECTIRYQWSTFRGVSRARNEGIAAARYDVLAMIDDDVFVTRTWFDTLIRSLLAADAKTVVTGQVLESDPEAGGFFAPSTKCDTAQMVYEHPTTEDVLYTGNMALYRSAIDDVGGFDERLGPGTEFPAAEDNDFSFRLFQRGYRILYQPGAALYHRAWRTEQEYLPLRWKYGVGRGAFYAKHLHRRDRYTLHRMLWDIEQHVLSATYRFRRERLLAYGDIVLIGGILFGATKWILTQRKTR